MLVFQAGSVFSQQISIDRGVRAEGLWCFPLVSDSLIYVYLPDESQLAMDKNKNPQFSFVRYVSNVLSERNDNSANSITQAQGGAILHFLVTYSTDQNRIAKALESLKEITGNDNVQIRGPVIFKEGHYALVSSIINPDNGTSEKKLLATGMAPVLEGSRIALSFELDPQRSKLLLESFKMNTPDISIVFDFTFSGLSDAYNAKLTVDWSEVEKYSNVGGGLKLYFVSAEIEKIYQDLQKNSAIRLESSGNSTKMEALINNVYNKLTDLLFTKTNPEVSYDSKQAAPGGMLGSLLAAAGKGKGTSGNIFPFGASATYKKKNTKSSGSSVLYFNSRESTDRHHYITFNIGDFYRKYWNNTNYFRTISMDDPDFAQREISIGVDGALMPEFDKLINSVTVTLRKKHGNGSTTLDEAVIGKADVNSATPIRLVYGSVGDTNRLEWLNYEYKAFYQFKGGKNYETPWISHNSAMINLFVPYERRVLQVEGDSALLKSKNVRAVVLQVEYPFFGENRKVSISVKPEESFNGKELEVTLPTNQFDYRYSISWIFKNGTQKTFSGKNEGSLVFIDNVPE
jgi:hypothetical protein